MPSDLDIEILTIDDSAPLVKTTFHKTKNPLKKKGRTVRKSTGVGGKAPHVVVPFKPLRKSLAVKPPTPKKSKNVNPEYFDVEDGEDSDDEIQVIEHDPLDDIEVVSDGEMFCDMCGLFLESSSDMELHHETVHQLTTCKWCNLRLGISEIKNHIGSNICQIFKKAVGSHCSVHDQIETDAQLEMEDFRNCRPLRCNTCSQRYDSKSLKDLDEKTNAYICPGCLHGKIYTTDSEKDTRKEDETVVITKSPSVAKAGRPVPKFLSTPYPVPLPEILLLDESNDPPKQIDSAAEVDKSADIVEPRSRCSDSTERSSGSLTSKLVDLINTELQGKNAIEPAANHTSKEEIMEVEKNETKETHCISDKSSVTTQKIGIDAVQSPLKKGDKVKESSSMEVDDAEVSSVSDPTKNHESEKAVNVESESNKIDEQEKDASSLGVDIDIVEVDVGADLNNRHEVDSFGLDEKEACSEIEIIENETAKNVSSEEIKLDYVNAASSNDNHVNVGDVLSSAPVTESKFEGEANENNDAQSSNCQSVSEDFGSLGENSPLSSSSAQPEVESGPEQSLESLSLDSEVSPVTPSVRRVARKSTKPPQRPQRTYENINELLLFENLNTEAIASPSPKRKLASPTSARKVARKSTRRPCNPQRALFSEKAVELEMSQANNSLDAASLDAEAALLQATPEKNLRNSLNDLEVLDEIVIC